MIYTHRIIREGGLATGLSSLVVITFALCVKLHKIGPQDDANTLIWGQTQKKFKVLALNGLSVPLGFSCMCGVRCWLALVYVLTIVLNSTGLQQRLTE